MESQHQKGLPSLWHVFLAFAKNSNISGQVNKKIPGTPQNVFCLGGGGCCMINLVFRCFSLHKLVWDNVVESQKTKLMSWLMKMLISS